MKKTLKIFLWIFFGSIALCVILVYALMTMGLINSSIKDNFSHIISVENIVPNTKSDEANYPPLTIASDYEAAFFAKDITSSSIIYSMNIDNKTILYSDSKEKICTFPQYLLIKESNVRYEKDRLVCIGQSWERLGPMDTIDQPTRRHVADYVYSVDIPSKKMKIEFKSRAKERVLYTDFSTVITYFDGKIYYYGLDSNKVLKTVDASFMKKHRKYTVKCLGDTIAISNAEGQVAEISIKV